MPGTSAFRADLSAAISNRLQAVGYILDIGQLGELLDDIEQVVVNDQATCIAQATADLGITTDPPVGDY
jgi:hypothetical protein